MKQGNMEHETGAKSRLGIAVIKLLTVSMHKLYHAGSFNILAAADGKACLPSCAYTCPGLPAVHSVQQCRVAKDVASCHVDQPAQAVC
jgi:hypothetical protein